MWFIYIYIYICINTEGVLCCHVVSSGSFCTFWEVRRWRWAKVLQEEGWYVCSVFSRCRCGIGNVHIVSLWHMTPWKGRIQSQSHCKDSTECQQINCYRGFEDQGFLDRLLDSSLHMQRPFMPYPCMQNFFRRRPKSHIKGHSNHASLWIQIFDSVCLGDPLWCPCDPSFLKIYVPCIRSRSKSQGPLTVGWVESLVPHLTPYSPYISYIVSHLHFQFWRVWFRKYQNSSSDMICID